MKIVLTLLSFVFLSACNSHSSSTSSINSDSSKNRNSDSMLRMAAVAKARLDSVKAAFHVWQYFDQPDKLTGGNIHIGELFSKDPLDLKFPYNDSMNYVALMLRSKRKETSVIILVKKGQFNSGVYGQNIQARFDEGGVELYSCSRPESGNSNSLFINNESKFINKLKLAKKLVIEAGFYDDGNQTMEFNVEGLKWK